MENKIIFSDINGILFFHDLLASNEPFLTIPDSLGRNAYLSPKLASYLTQIMKKGNTFHPISARDKNSFINVNDYFPYTSVALENGGVISDKEGNMDMQWYEQLKPFVGELDSQSKSSLHQQGKQLWDLERYLTSCGLITEYKNRIASVRLRAKGKGNLHLSELQKRVLEVYEKRSSEFPGIKIEIPEDAIDFIPIVSGKGNCIRYLAKKYGKKVYQRGSNEVVSGSIGLGHDINDMNLVKSVEIPMTLARAHPEILRIVMSNPNGWVSQEELYRGSRLILERILAN